MKSNESILFSITNREDVSIQECLDAMQVAQVEAINELVNRFRSQPVLQKGFRPVDDIALELIKEIES